MSKKTLKADVNQHPSHLLGIDLDGTALIDFRDLDLFLANVLRKLISEEHNHFVCIATGRNLQSSLPIANQIGKDIFLVTYNGARIDVGKRTWKFPIENTLARRIVKRLQELNFEPLNIMIDQDFDSDLPLEKRIITTSDDVYYQEIFFNSNPYTKAENLEKCFNLIAESDLLQLVLEFNYDKEKNLQIEEILRREFGSSIYFYTGNKMKAMKVGDKILVDDPSKWVVKIRSSNADKAKALEIISRYIGVDLEFVMPFGNDINDLDMMKKFGKSVAMIDSKGGIEEFAKSITKKNSKESGVAHYLIAYFGLSFLKS